MKIMLKKFVFGFLVFLVVVFIWDWIAKTFLEDKEFEFSSQVVDAIYANPSFARIGELQSFNLQYDTNPLPGSDSIRFTIAVQGRQSKSIFKGMSVRQAGGWRIAELQKK